MSGVGAAQTADEIKADLDGKEESPEKAVEKLGDPRMRDEWGFPLDYTDLAGRTWKGKFINRILTIDQINQVGVIRAKLCGNLPIDSLDVSTLDNAEMLSHLTVSLAKRPDWALKLGELKDPGLLRAIYVEVSSHEDMFHGRKKDPQAGAGGAGDAPG